MKKWIRAVLAGTIILALILFGIFAAQNTQNRLHREFWAGHPNEKWLTDVTEFKWYEGPIIHKLYLSAILDL